MSWYLVGSQTALLSALLLTDSAYALNTRYFVNCNEGNDSNSGTSTEASWKSLAKVNATTFGEGDSILFKTDCAWTGMLHPRGSGSPGGQAVIGKYGTGKRPHIAGNGAAAGVLLDGQEYWTIRDLEVTNNTTVRAIRSGISLLAKRTGITHRIRVLNNDVHDVYGENRRGPMYSNGAIFVSYIGRTTPENHFDDVLIEGNYLHDALTSGIRITQSNDMNLDYNHSNVVVRNNVVSKVGSDGMIIGHCDRPLIEYNTVLDAGFHGNIADTKVIAGIWMAGTKDAVFQYNEVARTRHFEADGTAYDTDWGAGGTTIFQYNYSHGNEGGFWLDCAKCALSDPAHVKTILRYNVSVDDMRFIARLGDNPAEFYNNVFYKTSGSLKPHDFDAGTRYSFWNNIFFFRSAVTWGKGKYENNLYYPFARNPADANGKSADPKLLNPGPAQDGMAFAANFKILPGSPCINAGRVVAGNGSKDFWGGSLSDGNPDIGAHEHGAITGLIPSREGIRGSQGTRFPNSVAYGSGWFDISGRQVERMKDPK